MRSKQDNQQSNLLPHRLEQDDCLPLELLVYALALVPSDDEDEPSEEPDESVLFAGGTGAIGRG